MSTTLPLPNLPTTPKSTPPMAGAAAGVSAPSRGGEEGGLSFKQSLQKVEPKAKQPAAEAPSKAAQSRAEKTPQAATEEASEQQPAPFAHAFGGREAATPTAVQSPAGLTYLARLAAATAAEEATEQQADSLNSGDAVVLIDPAVARALGDASAGSSVGTLAGVTPNIEARALLASKMQSRGGSDISAPAAAELTLSGKILPQPLQTAAPGVELQSQTVGTAMLDAISAPTALAGALKGAGGDFKALLNEAGTVGSALVGASSAALVGEAEGQPGLATAALTNPPGPSVQLEGRTSIPLNIAFGTAQWSNSLAERTAWMAGQAIHAAEIQLDPPELGPLQVKIQVSQDQASVNFVSANPLVREAVEQTMGRLRELFQGQGMELVDSGVADQQTGQQRERGEATDLPAGSTGLEGDEPTAEPSMQGVVSAVPWSVDYYA